MNSKKSFGNILHKLNIPLYLTYDDVLILPSFTNLERSDIDLSTRLTKNIELSLPIIGSPMDTVCEEKMALGLIKEGGIGIIHRNQSVDAQILQVKKVIKEKMMVGAAVGIGSDFRDRVKKIIDAGVKLICIDHSIGHSHAVFDAVKFLKKNYAVDVMAGNVATYDGAKYLFEAGADILRVGKGAGSICISRKISGIGVPQFSAITETARAAKKYKRSIVADGGIRSSGDIVKAMAAGADAVMLGLFISGTDESPGNLKMINGKAYKYYRGMGSSVAMKNGSADRYGQEKCTNKKNLIEEGMEGYIEYKGKLSDVIYNVVGGIKSGFVNVGAKNIKELQEKAKFIQITRAGEVESNFHDILEKDSIN